PPTETVHDRLSRAKISVIFSRQEGPCVVVAESFFSGTPVGLLDGAVVGTAAHINSQTGRLLRGRRLHLELSKLIEDSGTFYPRKWAEDNISCHKSISKLNAFLREYSVRRGRPWTTDLVGYDWRPYPAYVDKSEAMSLLPARSALQAA